MFSFLDKVSIGTPRIRRVVFWLFISFIAYILFGFLAVPPILKSVMLHQIDTNLKRPASIEEIHFNPLTLHLEVTGLKIRNLKEEGDLVSVGSLMIAPGIATIWELAPVIAYLRLDDFNFNITFYGDGQYSISDLLGTPDSVDQPEDKRDESEQADAVFPFALYGFEMTNANITFDDRPHNKKHVIADIFLRVPFTSSISNKVKEFTQPKFTAVVNGDPVELKGRTLPFDKTLLTEFELGAVNINLDQYWKYVPIKTPLKLKSGRFTSDISLYFERPDAQRLNLFLGGGGTLTGVDLEDPKEGSVFSFKELAFEVERFSLGDNALIFNSLTLDKPFFKVIRAGDNEINWAGYFPGSEMGPTGPKVKTEADTDSAFVMDIRNFELKDGTLDTLDRVVTGGYKRTYTDLNFSGSGLSTQNERPCTFKGSLGKEGIISLSGLATLEPLAATIAISGENLSVPSYGPYINHVQPLIVDSGTAGFSADIGFKMVDEEPELTVANGLFSLTSLAVRKPKAQKPCFTMDALTVSGAALDLKEQSVSVDEIKVSGPSASVTREKDGQFDLQKEFAKDGEQAVAENRITPVVDAARETWAGGWQATFTHIIIEDGTADFRDLTVKNPATLGLRKFRLDLKDLTTTQDTVMPFALDGTWAGGGTFSAQGKASIEPLWSDGKIQVEGVGLRPLDNYLAENTDLLIAKGTAFADLEYTFKGGDQSKVTVTGKTALGDLQMKTTFDDNELAGIDRLDVTGIAFATEPNTLSIGEIRLDGPRAFVHFAKDGRLNIRRALHLPEPVPPVEKDKKAASANKAAGAVTDAAKEVLEAEVDTAEAMAKAHAGKPFFENLEISKVSMQNGTVRFKDDSMQPGFATELTAMTLSLTEIGKTPEARPKVDFKANIGPTPMSVTGVLNPVISPIYSDLAISVNGMELVPLTPYTLKNLAYPVEKGRLYADVTFKTEDWVLDAKNKFFIEQLKLGKKDKRPDAPNVPVEFGLTLLQDSNGNMELNLPISGRLDDPNFRIGGIVFKAIVNLFFKALASPFSLIGSIFGGGEDMDFVVFEPGRATLDAGGEAKMATIIKAMTERSKLKLSVDGVIDPNADKNGLIRVILERKIKQAKYDSLPRSKRAETTVDKMVISPEEYEDMLYEAYADEPDEEGVKPTTLFVTDRQPVEVMEKFIRDRIVITDELLNKLALQRATAVKEHIITKAPELTERVFLLDRREKATGKTGVPAHRADLGIK